MGNTKYSEMGKDALISEIKARRTAGREIKVDLRADVDTLRTALEMDDMDHPEDETATTTEGTPAGAGSADDAGTGADSSPTAPPAPEAPAPAKPTVAAKASGLPPELRNQIARQPEAPTKPTQPTDEEFAAGSLARNKSDGFIYQVVKRDSDEFNKTVKARVPAQENGHPGLYWEGSDIEFAAVFEKI